MKSANSSTSTIDSSTLDTGTNEESKVNGASNHCEMNPECPPKAGQKIIWQYWDQVGHPSLMPSASQACRESILALHSRSLLVNQNKLSKLCCVCYASHCLSLCILLPIALTQIQDWWCTSHVTQSMHQCMVMFCFACVCDTWRDKKIWNDVKWNVCTCV